MEKTPRNGYMSINLSYQNQTEEKNEIAAPEWFVISYIQNSIHLKALSTCIVYFYDKNRFGLLKE